MTKIIDKWKQLNWDLYSVLDRINETLIVKVKRDIFINIAGGYIHKATKTLKAVNILYDNSLAEQAQALVRILFELRLNFDCFMKFASNDPKNACKRVIDSMMLEKVKQARASEFAGIPESMQNKLIKKEEEIAKNYSENELKKIRKFGFTGMPIEQRAKFTGHETAYHIVYRNFSRNVHSTDYTESYLRDPQNRGTGYADYILSRDVASLYTAHFSAGGIAEIANQVFSLNFDKELYEIGQRQQKIKDVPNKNITTRWT